MSADWYSKVSDAVRQVSQTAASSLDSLQEYLATNVTSSVLSAGEARTILKTATPPPPQSYSDIITNWVSDNKYTVAAIAGTSGIGLFIVYKYHGKKNKRRRAARTANASRKEVLLITNFTTNLISKLVALDLERRGYVVFCACRTQGEKTAIENEGHADIRPLFMNQDDSGHLAIERFGHYLNIPAPAYHGGHTLHFAGLILAPPSQLPTGPLELIDGDQFSRATEIGLSWPTFILQSFLPLLREHSGRIVFLNDWIIPSLHTPFYAPAVVTSHAIHALSKTISRELPSIFTIHIKLGTFDLPHHHGLKNGTRADILGWSPSVRAAYSSSYKNCTGKPMNARVRGAGLKELHHAVFDALNDSRPSRDRTVGAGVKLYQWIATLMPEAGLRYLLGIGITTGEDDWEVLDR